MNTSDPVDSGNVNREDRSDPSTADTKGLRERSALWAHHLRAWVFAMARCRFSIIVLAAGFGLLMSDQGRDLLVAYGDGDWIFKLIVTFCAAIWALSVWGWARTLLDINYERFFSLPDCIRCYNIARSWLPRVLGALAFVAVGWSSLIARQKLLTVWAASGLVLFLVFVIYRRQLANWLASKATRSKLESLTILARALEAPPIASGQLPPYEDLKAALQVPSDWNWKRWRDDPPVRAALASVLGLVWVALLILSTAWPVAVGTTLGAMVLLFVWGATSLPIGSFVSYWADKKQLPLLSSLLLLAVAASWLNDNHEIRYTDKTADVASRLSVTQGLDKWQEANSSPGTAPVPFIVVATAGGGIRAAYWTGTVLGSLHDANPDFDERLFAISGVSGGSLGATVYRALLDLDPAQRKEDCPKQSLKTCAQKVLSQELLGPVAAGLLFPDLMQRFVPWPVFPDRGAALERGWERAFEEVTGQDVLGAKSLVDLNRDPDKPSLFLNATWVDSGRRIVASNLRFAQLQSPGATQGSPTGGNSEAIAFARSNDELAILGRDLRLSTAAHNSARFPLVSPPGMWTKDGTIAGRLQDGGLFENYGAETALEILQLACEHLRCVSSAGTNQEANLTQSPSQAGERPVIPVVILISSDPTLPASLAASEPAEPVRFAYEIRSTFQAYEHVRSGRGQEAADQLRVWANDHGNNNFFHFRMCMDTEGAEPPLGWALSDESRDRIKSYLKSSSSANECVKTNHNALEALHKILSQAASPST